MCLVFIGKNVIPEYPLIVVGNRDEFYSRPTQPLHFWPEQGIYAGKDLTAGGTWWAVHQSGSICLLTNYRDLSLASNPQISRGQLVLKFFEMQGNADDFKHYLEQHGHLYDPFNIVFGRADELTHYNNITKQHSVINEGWNGLSNATINTPWPKVLHGKSLLQDWNQSKKREWYPLYALMQSSETFEHNLPATGLNHEQEVALSAMCIRTPNYGTVSTTILAMHKKGFLIGEKNYKSRQFNSFYNAL